VRVLHGRASESGLVNAVRNSLREWFKAGASQVSSEGLRTNELRGWFLSERVINARLNEGKQPEMTAWT